MVVVVVVGVVVVVVDVVSVIVAVVDIASGTVDSLQDSLEPTKDHWNEQIRQILVDKVLLVKSIKNLPSTFWKSREKIKEKSIHKTTIKFQCMGSLQELREEYQC